MLGMSEHKTWNRIRRWTGLEIALTVIVILGGAVVRASGSGAGCGEHWPLCNGSAIPWNPRLETVIEFTHRLSSGLSLLLFIGIFFYTRKHLPSAHPTRAWSRVALISFLLEAAIGAFLVLKRLVALDTSILRAVVIALHLINTYLLLAALIGMFFNLRTRVTSVGPRDLKRSSYWLLASWMIVGATGAIVALGDTLFPAASLLHGLQQDADPASHFLIRLRLVHPTLAVSVSLWTLLVTLGGRAGGGFSAISVTSLIFFQILIGLFNWLLLAPLWVQLAHLAAADMVWIALVAYALSQRKELSPDLPVRANS